MLQRAEQGDPTLLISRLNFGEVLYSLRKPPALRSQARTDSDLHALPITLISVEDRHVDAAVELKSRFAISYADCFVAALAMEHGAPLVTGDPEFRKLESAGLLKLHWLGA